LPGVDKWGGAWAKGSCGKIVTKGNSNANGRQAGEGCVLG